RSANAWRSTSRQAAAPPARWPSCWRPSALCCGAVPRSRRAAWRSPDGNPGATRSLVAPLLRLRPPRPGRPALRQELTGGAEAPHAAAVGIPQLEPRAAPASRQRQPRHVLQLGVLRHALAEPVVRDAAREMVHVVEADVAGEPVHHRREVEKRAALDARPVE